MSRRPPQIPAPAPLEPAAARRARSLARFLDNSIRVPIIGYRIGWDAVVGLVPGIGDAAGGLISCYIVLQAARLGASATTIVRMLANIGVEMLIGTVPLAGDLFDAVWKANSRNMRLLDRHLTDPAAARRASRHWLLAVVGGTALVMIGLIVLVFWILGTIIGGLTSAIPITA
jgi:hypothetical protein